MRSIKEQMYQANIKFLMMKIATLENDYDVAQQEKSSKESQARDNDSSVYDLEARCRE